MKSCSIKAAYGRHYENADQALADFYAGKDFILLDYFSRWDGKPCSIRDLNKHYEMVEIRYGKFNTFVIGVGLDHTEG